VGRWLRTRGASAIRTRSRPQIAFQSVEVPGNVAQPLFFLVVERVAMRPVSHRRELQAGNTFIALIARPLHVYL
jgi:hypothetical protein